MAEEAKKKAGLVCSYKDCKNKSYSGGNSFYRFPEDVERAKSWLAACCRPDLLNKIGNLHKSHRICGVHFSPRMFRKGKRQILRKDAVPVKFVSSEDETVPSTSISSTEPSQVPCTSILYRLLEPSASTIDNSTLKTESESIQLPPIRYFSRSVQTSAELTFRSPRVVKLREINNALKLENKALKRDKLVLLNKCKRLEKKLQEILEDTITLKQYKKATQLSNSKK